MGGRAISARELQNIFQEEGEEIGDWIVADGSSIDRRFINSRIHFLWLEEGGLNRISYGLHGSSGVFSFREDEVNILCRSSEIIISSKKDQCAMLVMREIFPEYRPSYTCNPTVSINKPRRGETRGQAILFEELKQIISNAPLGDWVVAGGSRVPNGFRGCWVSEMSTDGSGLNKLHYTKDCKSLDFCFQSRDVKIIQRSNLRIRIVSSDTRHDLLVLHHRLKKEIGRHISIPKNK